MAEGYTCDCYEGYELDMTSMACIGRYPSHNPQDKPFNYLQYAKLPAFHLSFEPYAFKSILLFSD